MPNKIVTVIKREYMTRVKSKGFIVSLFLMPVLMSGMVLLSSFLTIIEGKTEKIRKIAIIDETGEIFTQMQAVIAGHSTFQHKGKLVYQLDEESGTTQETRTVLRERVNTKVLYAYLEIPKDVFESGEVRFYARTATNFEVQSALRGIISNIVRDKRFAESGYPRAEVSRLMRSVRFNAYAVKSSKGKDGDTAVESPLETGARIGLGYILVFVFTCSFLFMPTPLCEVYLKKKQPESLK